jgi:predicted nucleic acid-binding protein
MLFLDTNIILDLVLNRPPYTTFAQKIFSRSQRLKIELYVSALTIPNINYILTKVSDKKLAKQILLKIKPLITILPLNDKIIQLALASDFDNFEDAIQYYTALEHNITTLITRDLKDFKKAKISVMTAEQYLRIGGNELKS